MGQFDNSLTAAVIKMADDIGLREQLRVYHEANKRDRQSDRDVFRDALDKQRELFTASMDKQADMFQAAIQQMFIKITDVEKLVLVETLKTTMIVGDGSPGQGRLGKLEESVDTLKKFRWQMLAVLSFVLLLADRLGPTIKDVFGR